jgi:regulator of extracellular matrix RemA (YlzA/DUF370 family)
MPVNIGYGNRFMSSKMVAILVPKSASMRRPNDDTKERNMLVDATQVSIVITDSDPVILSAVQVGKLAQRLFGGDAA